MTEKEMIERSSLRVVRFLERGEARVSEAAKDGRLMLDGGDRGVISIKVSLLRTLLDTGDIRIEEDVVRLQTVLDSGRRQHETAIVETGEGCQTVTVNIAESPLALLWRHKARNGGRFLSEAEFRAGERLRADYARGQIMPRLGVNWNAAGASGRKQGDANGIADMTDAALAARRRVENAIVAVGPELAGVLIDVCCFLKGLERVEIERGWPVRSAKVVLKSALSALARHYEPPRQRPADKVILHWGTDDYRPSLG